MLCALEYTQARSPGIAEYLFTNPAVTSVPLSAFTLIGVHNAFPDNLLEPGRPGADQAPTAVFPAFR